MSSHKIDRINAEVSRAISEILAMEAKDELLKTITITGADVTNDLSYAKIYFTALSDKEVAELEKEMNDASRFIRGRLSEKIDLRYTPELKFFYDKSIEYGKKIENIIKNLD